MATINERKVLLLDTPGFDDSARENIEVLNDIISHFYVYALRRTELETRGVIFLHDISEIRFGGSQKKTLNILKALVGEEHMGNVIVGTTMWSALGSRKFRNEEERERRLLDDQWEGIYKTTRVPCDDIEAANRIVTDLFTRPPVILLSQEEMLLPPHTVENTTAGRIAMPEGRLEMEELQREQRKQANKFKQETEKLEANFKSREDEIRQKFEVEAVERDKLFEEEKKKWNAEAEAQAKQESLKREAEVIRNNKREETRKLKQEEENQRIEADRRSKFELAKKEFEEDRRREFEEEKKKIEENAKKEKERMEKELEEIQAAMKASTKPPELGWFMRIADAVVKWFGFKGFAEKLASNVVKAAVNQIKNSVGN